MLKQDYAQQRLLWRPLRRLAVGGGWPWAAAGYCGGWLLRRLAAQPRCGKRVQGAHPSTCGGRGWEGVGGGGVPVPTHPSCMPSVSSSRRTLLT